MNSLNGVNCILSPLPVSSLNPGEPAKGEPCSPLAALLGYSCREVWFYHRLFPPLPGAVGAGIAQIMGNRWLPSVETPSSKISLQLCQSALAVPGSPLDASSLAAQGCTVNLHPDLYSCQLRRLGISLRGDQLCRGHLQYCHSFSRHYNWKQACLAGLYPSFWCLAHTMRLSGSCTLQKVHVEGGI